MKEKEREILGEVIDVLDAIHPDSKSAVDVMERVAYVQGVIETILRLSD